MGFILMSHKIICGIIVIFLLWFLLESCFISFKHKNIAQFHNFTPQND